MKEDSKTHFGTTSINMLKSVVAFVFATANIGITQSVAAWEALMTTLRSNVQSIDNMRLIAKQVITGYASQKLTAKRVVVQMSAAIMRSVYSFAVQSGNKVLADAMFVNRSSLSQKKYLDLVTFVQTSIDTVRPLIPQLEDYNITTALVDQWQESNAILSDLLTGPNNAKNLRISYNKDIQQLLRSSIILLTQQADGMALNFANNPDTVNYYNQYRANRKLQPHHMSTQLRATVYNGDAPASNAIVAIGGTQLSNITNSDGYCLIDHIPFGNHNVTVTIDTVTQDFGSFRFKKGKSLTMSFNMQAFDVPAVKTKAMQKANA